MLNPSQSVVIAVDCMGGDNAPQDIIAGIDLFSSWHPESRYLLFGNKGAIQPLVDESQLISAQNAEIIHCTDVVSSEDQPSIAIRKRKESSMAKVIEAVKDGRAHGAISAGNTGALMAFSIFTLGKTERVHRPAIVAPIPTINGEACMLDMGANTVCSAHNLTQFAVMGSVYARTALGIEKPRVGLLNIGSEAIKGRSEIQNAAEILNQSSPHFEWCGYIEGHDISLGKCDVVVTDGFTGNVVIKTGEGVIRMFTDSLRDSFQASPFARIGYIMARRQLQKLSLKLDPRRYNGAMLMGLNGLVVKSHGNADKLAFANALSSFNRMVKGNFMDLIDADLYNLKDNS